MKRLLLFLILLFISIVNVNAEELATNSKSAILIEATTGEIIMEKNKDERLAPASMTKIMSLIIIMEELEKGNLKLDEDIKISKNAASMGGSQIYLEADEVMSVEDLLKAICMASANDAVVALAERISGSEEAFTFKMNEKAKKMNLKNTHFDNATGLDSQNHYSSAHDMAIMAKELVKHQKVLDYSSRYEDYLRENTNKRFWLVNTNKMLKSYKGLDGLKTGYTTSAGYCLTATAKKKSMRLIGVVMGEPSSIIRNDEMSKILDFGFNLYEVTNLVDKDTVLGKYKNSKMKNISVNIVPSEQINIINKKGNKKRKVTYNYRITNTKLPIKKGNKVGILNIYENKKVINKIDITVDKNVKKANIIELYIKNFLKNFSKQ